jgi:hypothetical protein
MRAGLGLSHAQWLAHAVAELGKLDKDEFVAIMLREPSASAAVMGRWFLWRPYASSHPLLGTSLIQKYCVPLRG